jgi:hypothetical protein
MDITNSEYSSKSSSSYVGEIRRRKKDMYEWD